MCSEDSYPAMGRRDFLKLGAAGLAGAVLLGSSAGGAQAQTKTGTSLREEIRSAANEYEIPEELLLAMGYVKHHVGDAPAGDQRVRPRRATRARRVRHHATRPKPRKKHFGQSDGSYRALGRRTKDRSRIQHSRRGGGIGGSPRERRNFGARWLARGANKLQQRGSVPRGSLRSSRQRRFFDQLYRGGTGTPFPRRRRAGDLRSRACRRVSALVHQAGAS